MAREVQAQDHRGTELGENQVFEVLEHCAAHHERGHAVAADLSRVRPRGHVDPLASGVYRERAAVHSAWVDKALRAATVEQAVYRETIYLNVHGGSGELVRPGLVQGGGCQQQVK